MKFSAFHRENRFTTSTTVFFAFIQNYLKAALFVKKFWPEKWGVSQQGGS